MLECPESMKQVISSVAPMLSVRHGARAIKFYKSAFGAIEVFRLEDPGGSVVARPSVDGAEFWVADESPNHGNFSPESLGGGTVRMVMTVKSPDATIDRVITAGATEVCPSTRSMAGASAASLIRSAIIGKSASPFHRAVEWMPLPSLTCCMQAR
jgi:PhnB protein